MEPSTEIISTLVEELRQARAESREWQSRFDSQHQELSHLQQASSALLSTFEAYFRVGGTVVDCERPLRNACLLGIRSVAQLIPPDVSTVRMDELESLSSFEDGRSVLTASVANHWRQQVLKLVTECQRMQSTMAEYTGLKSNLAEARRSVDSLQSRESQAKEWLRAQLAVLQRFSDPKQETVDDSSIGTLQRAVGKLISTLSSRSDVARRDISACAAYLQTHPPVDIPETDEIACPDQIHDATLKRLIMQLNSQSVQIQRLRDEVTTSRQSLSDQCTELDRAKHGAERHAAAVSQWRDDCQTAQKRAADLESQLLALQAKYMQARAEKRSAAAKSTAALRELEEQVLSLTAFVGQSDVQ